MNNLKRKYFELWADQESQNFILKWLLIFSSVLITAESASICVLALKKPTLVAIGSTESKVLTLAPPSDALLRSELSRTVQKYIEAHYNWTYTTIEKAHEEASKYVSDGFRKSFIAANLEQIRQAKEKKVTQRVYLNRDALVDPEKMIAKVSLDRIFTVEGIKATAPLSLEVGFNYGPRTSQNPEGIYIISEKMLSDSEK